MTRGLPILLIAFAFSFWDTRDADAWVMMGVLPKGEVPHQYCSEELSAVLRKVPPIRGETIDGFSHYSCVLYYRGAHSNLQDLLDDLAKIKDVDLMIEIDRSGKVGNLVSRKVFPMKRAMPYTYSVRLSWQTVVDNGTLTPLPRPMLISVQLFSAGGIEPDKLTIPDR